MDTSNEAKDLLESDTQKVEVEDGAASPKMAGMLSEEEQEELSNDLAKVEEEIQTLSQVLAAKERRLAEIKRKLGITPLNELRQNLTKSWEGMTSSPAYFALAIFLMLASSIRSIQHSISMPAMRNSQTFKSFEEKVENIKTKVGGNKPAGGDFGDVLNSTANAGVTEPLTEEPHLAKDEP
ncbi:tumor protein D52-like [Protopterus annectens]|uniref:tumor protein D52-like n=1 Tax=Protopterus annectens TaxID=7888 RepID=UPI001CFA07EC|nr:tumor protein D52-like [Protopterus annectens]